MDLTYIYICLNILTPPPPGPFSFLTIQQDPLPIFNSTYHTYPYIPMYSYTHAHNDVKTPIERPCKNIPM